MVEKDNNSLIKKIKLFIIKHRKVLAVLAVLAALVTTLIIVFFPTSSERSEGVSIPNIPNTPPSSSSEICTDCNFLKSMRDYSNLTCTPSNLQKNAIKNMDSERIKYCGENICLHEMEQLLINCFKSVNSECGSCEFINLFTESCMENAYSKITDIYDNDKTRLQKRLFVSDECGCTPTLEQFDLFNRLVSNNIESPDGSYLILCQEAGCPPETDDIYNKCLFETKSECYDCVFFSTLFSDCATKSELSEYPDDFERKKAFAKKCNCIPTSLQLGILDNIKSEGITHNECINENLEPSQYCNSVKSLTELCLPSGTLPPPQSKEDPTDPPGFDYPTNCSNCQYVEKLSEGCVSNGIEAADISNITKKYGITLSCGCTPTDTQLQVTQDILDKGILFDECVENNCEELSSISNGC